jgi:hypothetical protein
MTTLEEPVFGDLQSLGRAAPVHVTTNPAVKLEMIAKGKHVVKNEATGM